MEHGAWSIEHRAQDPRQSKVQQVHCSDKESSLRMELDQEQESLIR